MPGHERQGAGGVCGDGAIFPHDQPGYKYYLEQVAQHPNARKGSGTHQVASSMQLE